MNEAFDIIVDRLIISGLTETEALHLIGRFLEEEAETYVEMMRMLETPEKMQALN